MGIGDVGPFPAGDDQRAFLLEAVEMRPRMQEMVAVHLPQAVIVELVMKRIEHEGTWRLGIYSECTFNLPYGLDFGKRDFE